MLRGSDWHGVFGTLRRQANLTGYKTCNLCTYPINLVCTTQKSSFLFIRFSYYPLLQAKGHFTIFDCAYQGFVTGDPDVDARPVRLFIERDLEFMAAQSFSKNFGLYSKFSSVESWFYLLVSCLWWRVNTLHKNPQGFPSFMLQVPVHTYLLLKLARTYPLGIQCWWSKACLKAFALGKHKFTKQLFQPFRSQACFAIDLLAFLRSSQGISPIFPRF